MVVFQQCDTHLLCQAMHQRSVLADIAEVAFLSFKKGQCRRGAILQKVQTSTAEGGAQHGIGHGPLQQAAAIGENLPGFIDAVHLTINLCQGGCPDIDACSPVAMNCNGSGQLGRTDALGLKHPAFLQIARGSCAFGYQGHFGISLVFGDGIVIQHPQRLPMPPGRRVGNGQQRRRAIAGYRIVARQGAKVLE
ncbi:hypothetical protein D9M71_285090 [compost metagenome]